MNKVEFWLMNNPIRAFLQGFEARKLRSISDLPNWKDRFRNRMRARGGYEADSKIFQAQEHPSH